VTGEFFAPACASFLGSGRTERPGLPVRMELAGVGRNVAEDGELVDVRVVFGIESFELRVDGFVAGAGQAGVSLVDLDVGVSDAEVGHVVVAGQPRRHGVGDFIRLGREVLSLDEAGLWY
jgi:hypothetical protein